MTAAFLLNTGTLQILYNRLACNLVVLYSSRYYTIK